mgnify:CR=1 FL=1
MRYDDADAIAPSLIPKNNVVFKFQSENERELVTGGAPIIITGTGCGSARASVSIFLSSFFFFFFSSARCINS